MWIWFLVGLVTMAFIWQMFEFVRKIKLRKSRTALMNHDYNKALKQVETALALPFLHPVGKIVIGRYYSQILYQSGQYAKALLKIDDVLAWIAQRPSPVLTETTLNLWNMKASCLDALNREDEANQCRSAAIDLWMTMGDKDGTGAFEAAITAQQQGDYGLAMARMRVAVEKAENEHVQSVRWMHLAMMASEIGSFEEAIDYGKSAYPGLFGYMKGICLIGLADWHLHLGDIETAKQFLDSAEEEAGYAENARLSVQVLIARAEIMYIEGMQQAAIDYLYDALNKTELKWVVYTALSERLLQYGKIDKSIQAFELGLKEYENDPSVTQDLRGYFYTIGSRIYYENEKLAKAEKMLSNALDFNIKRPRYLTRVHALAALIYARLENQERSAEHYNEAMKIISNYNASHYMKLEKGLVTGQYHLLQGQPDKASKGIEEALQHVKLERDLPIFYYYLGEAKLAEGEKEAAIIAYNKVKSSKFETLFTEKAIKRLSELQATDETHIIE